MVVSIELTVNQQKQRLEVEPRATLLEVLRDQLHIKSVHRGCEEGECGACTVLLNGAPICSCITFAVQADGGEITTVEGILKEGKPHPIMRAFLDHYGMQCGYCTSGILLTSYFLITNNRKSTEEEIRRCISGNLCRCTGYVNIVKSIEAAIEMKESGDWW